MFATTHARILAAVAASTFLAPAADAACPLGTWAVHDNTGNGHVYDEVTVQLSMGSGITTMTPLDPITWSSGQVGAVVTYTSGDAGFGDLVATLTNSDDDLMMLSVQPPVGLGTLHVESESDVFGTSGFPGAAVEEIRVTLERLDFLSFCDTCEVFHVLDVRVDVIRLCASDLDGDGLVGVNELVSVITHWGSCPDAAAPCPADVDCDGVVDVDDLVRIIGDWGACTLP